MNLKKEFSKGGLRRFVPVLFALLAALLFGLNAPVSKLLVTRIDPLFLASLLYLGAGAGMLVIDHLRRAGGRALREAPLTRQEFPFIVLMVLLDILAPVMLMLGLQRSNAGTAALLGNFEIVATAVFALILFREAVGRRLWLAIGLIFIASLLLSVDDFSTLNFSIGSLFVLASCVCWGIENNCTRVLSVKDPLQVVVVKGFGSGFGALLLALIWGDFSAPILYIIFGLLLGFVAYGLSIYFYVTAQRSLGAARTSAFYAAAPFIGVVISWIFLKEAPTTAFLTALVLMLLGVFFILSEQHDHSHVHPAEAHEHNHTHNDLHHDHLHEDGFSGEHSHSHSHLQFAHEHAHLPDVHHRHRHLT